MLTDVAIRGAKPGSATRKLSDGGGLQLWVQPSGSKLWRLAYRFGGKQKLLPLGSYPLMRLPEARRKRDGARLMIAAGSDPMALRKEAKSAKSGSETFGAIAEDYIAKRKREGRAAVTLTKTRWLVDMATPALGKLPIDAVTTKDVYDVLKKVEARGIHETAHRLRSTIGAIFRFAMASGRAQSDPTVALSGALAQLSVRSHSAIIAPAAFGALLRAIDGYDGQLNTRIGLQLLTMLFPRPGELRAAEWREFDMRTAIWTIPAERTKMRRPHRVPLPAKAVALLEQLFSVTGDGDFVFPSINAPDRSMSENTLNAALRRLGYSGREATSHGFRATAATLLNESGKWHPDAVERQLAHVESNAVRRAYTRGEHWDERVRMMDWWADHLNALRASRPPSLDLLSQAA